MTVEWRRRVRVLDAALQLSEVGIRVPALEQHDLTSLDRSVRAFVRLHVLDADRWRGRPAGLLRGADARGHVDDAGRPDAIRGGTLSDVMAVVLILPYLDSYFCCTPFLPALEMDTAVNRARRSIVGPSSASWTQSSLQIDRR
jgi:hypothetical protein